MELAVEAGELHKTYPPDVKAVDGVSLSVPAGSIFALLGPNGAGKSTTVRLLTTLSRPDSGQARVVGFDVLADTARVRREIGVVGQKHGADMEATGRENLVLHGEFYGMSGRTLRARVDELLARFGLADAADRVVKTYSGGMQRRLDVAMGLLHSPQVLFLDEPTSGLDPETRAQMWHEIERLSQEERVTVLLTTHYMEEADRLAAEVAIIDRGRVVAQGSPEELKRSLGGDTVQIELSEATAVELLPAERPPGVDELTIDGRLLRARVADGAQAIPPLLAALESRGIVATSVTMTRPTLEDVYMRHAGRAFEQAEREHEEAAA